VALTIPAVVGAASVTDEDLAAMKTQIEMLQNRIDQLESEERMIVHSYTPPTSGGKTAGRSADGYWRIPGTNTGITVGGYAKLDVIYNDVTTGDNSAANRQLSLNSIPIEGTEEGTDHIALYGSESRLWFKSKTDTDLGPLSSHIEMDFDTHTGNQVVSNSNFARIRHAYINWNNWLLGRTWSTAMILQALPETNDFGGPGGQLFVRQGQVRKTWPLNGGANIQLAFENPETFVWTSTGGRAAIDDDRIPDIFLRGNWKNEAFNLSGLLAFRQLREEQGVTNDSENVYWASLGGRWNVGVGKDNLRGALSFGDGIGRYSSLAFVPDAQVINGKLEPLAQFGGNISYQHWWNETMRSSLVFGYIDVDNNAGAAGDPNTKAYSIHANFMHEPVQNLRLGIEYIFGKRELESGLDGELNRLQFSSRYVF
jgi:hypothetical protein